MSDKVTISASEYKKMQRDIEKLNALEAGGVDNWEWYSESLSEWNKVNAVDELFDRAVMELHERLVEADVEEPAGRGAGYNINLDEKNCHEFFSWLIKEYNGLEDDE